MHHPLIRFMLIPAVLAALLGACATRLAPLYDRNLVEGLTTVNADALELMASAAEGTQRETFATREPRYNNVIGRLDALALQASARPAPRNNVPAAVHKIMESRGIALQQDRNVPSAAALMEISRIVSKMRDTDRKQGLNAMEVTAFKGSVLIFMDQALTYEAALER